jgi:hypothetical protein
MVHLALFKLETSEQPESSGDPVNGSGVTEEE